MQAQHLDLLISAADGAQRTEPVHVQPLGTNRYRLLHSPGMVEGIAAGDEFELLDPIGAFRVLARGGNLAVHIWCSENIVLLLAALSRLASSVGGTVDGNVAQAAVLTIPLSARFSAIEAALDGFIRQHPSCRWYYGNVYSPLDGVTPLRWWEDP